MRVLLTGADGYLAQYLQQYAPSDAELFGTVRSEPHSTKLTPHRLVHLDLAHEIAPQLKAPRFDLIIHTAAMSSLAECEKHPRQAFQINRDASAALAGRAAEQGARFVFLSTDIVFDGDSAPYSEESACEPVNVYGRSKLEAERAVLQTQENVLVVRLPLLLGAGPGKHKNFIDWFIARLESNHEVPLFVDEWRTPLAASFAAQAIWKLAGKNTRGTVHLPGGERINRLQLGQKICDILGCNRDRLKAISLKDVGGPARPADTTMISVREDVHDGLVLPAIGKTLAEILKPQ